MFTCSSATCRTWELLYLYAYLPYASQDQRVSVDLLAKLTVSLYIYDISLFTFISSSVAYLRMLVRVRFRYYKSVHDMAIT